MRSASQSRSIAAINYRLATGLSVVAPLSGFLAGGISDAQKEKIDIITLSFASPINGTAAMLCVPVAGRGVFTRAEEIRLNGVSGVVGPAPNERLGLVDTMVYSHTESITQNGYFGAHLFQDLLRRRVIEVECESIEKAHFAAKVQFDDLEFARFYGFNVFVDASLPASVWTVIGRGSRILLNSANGIILGPGTRDGLKGRRSWSMAADMKAMDSDVMSDIDPSSGHHIGNMIAVAIPIFDLAMLDDLSAWRSMHPINDSLVAAEKLLARRLAEGNFTLTDTDARC